MSNFSLLDGALFSVELKDGRTVQCSLPALLAALCADDVLSFSALQAHQSQAWYAFLVQLAAMAVVRASGGEILEGEDDWRAALVDLAKGSEAAWCLGVPDVSEPAFMQPPIPEGSLEAASYKADILSPSSLDVLVTSKNHDVKQERIAHPQAEHWIYALVTLQTMEGFLGRGNYGIIRANGGFGNRPMVGLSPGLSFGARFRRDLRVLCEQREAMNENFDRENGHTLLWLEPWAGPKTSDIHLYDCDPYFIEICRRIRFVLDDGALVCWRANTKGQRLDAPDALNGITDDPWTPIDIAENKALTLGGEGFTYQKLQAIFLSDAYKHPVALERHAHDEGVMYLTARAMVRGQGKTEGLHHRIVPMPPRVTVLLQRKSDRQRLADRAEERVTLADEAQRRVLYPAFAALLSGGKDRKLNDREQGRVRAWTRAFDQAIDARFFDSLWDAVEKTNEEAAAAWQAILLEEARAQFGEAKGSTPIAAVHRWQALSKAQSLFDAGARHVLPHAFLDSEEDEAAPTEESEKTEASA